MKVKVFEGVFYPIDLLEVQHVFVRYGSKRFTPEKCSAPKSLGLIACEIDILIYFS